MGSSIHINGAWKQEITPENDRFIMDEIIKEIKSSNILKRINELRLYLKISRLSDMATTDGGDIRRWAMYRPPQNNLLKWPKRRYPWTQI